MQYFKCLVLFAIFIIAECNAKGSVVEETAFGKLQGTVEHSRDGKEYFAFRGIPYAQKPQRFEIAKLHQPWDGTRTATAFGNPCPHFDPPTKSILGEDEDCLFLNVYTPTKDKTKKLAVMVWFHPGSFIIGKSNDYDPKYFMDEDVVVVTLNYRLGAFGFLATGDDAVPANLGLRDQVVALQWVQKTISSFGGDPGKVTIFGCSAGGASVHFHILSPLSKGLFQDAIIQSGSALAPWALNQGDPLTAAKMLGEKLKCPTDSTNMLIECLKAKPALELFQGQIMHKWMHYPVNVFLPVIETKEYKNGVPRFLQDHPLSLMSSGQFQTVPMIIGFTEEEGAQESASVILNETALSELNDEWAKLTPLMLKYDHINPTSDKDNITQKMLKQYFWLEEISDINWDDLTKLISDRQFIYPSDKAARTMAKYGTVYPYVFSFPGVNESPGLKSYFGISGDYGVGHTDELQYLFSGLWGAEEYTDPLKHEVYEFSKSFVKLWTSFAKHSKPIATWKKELKWDPISPKIRKSINYYVISTETSISDEGLADRMKFLDDLNIDKFPSIKEDTKSNNKDEL